MGDRHRIIRDLIREGWNPPVPDREQTERVVADIAAAQGTLSLTAHEANLLAMIASGDTATEIANKLDRSHETMRSHQKTIRHKLGARTMAHAVAIGFREGFLV